MSMEIRDTRNGDWHWVYNALLADPHLTAGEKLVYSAISTFGGHQVIHPTKEQLSERCSLDEKTVQRAIRKLEEVGYLSMDKSIGRGNANVYYLLKKSKGCNLCPFVKGDIEDLKRGHLRLEKGTETTPYIDKYKDKKDISETDVSRVVEISEEEESPKKISRAKYPHSKEVFKTLFPATYDTYWGEQTTFLKHGEWIYKVVTAEGDSLQDFADWCKRHEKCEFFPQADTPHEMFLKWAKFDRHLNECGV